MALIRIAGIEAESIVDGPGYRYVIFTQGCPHLCPGCHNPLTHDFNGGKFLDTEEIVAALKDNPFLDGVTFSGGEPFCQAGVLNELVPVIKELGFNLMIYTGYTWEYLLNWQDEEVQKLLHSADYLVDGPFIEAEKDLTLNFRGSANQRIINVQQSLTCDELILEEF